MITRKLIGLLVAFAILPTLLVAQTERISINMTDVTLNDVLNEIEKQTSFSFLVNEKIIDVTRKVDAVYKDVSITEILDNLFKDGTIQYVISNRQIILTPKKDNPQQEKVKPMKVSGRITDIGTNEP